MAAYWNQQKKETKFVDVLNPANTLLQPYKVLDYNINSEPFYVCLAIEDSSSVKRLACMSQQPSQVPIQILKVNMAHTAVTLKALVCEAKLTDRPNISAELDYLFKCLDGVYYAGSVTPQISQDGTIDLNTPLILKEGSMKKISATIQKPFLIGMTPRYAVYWGDDFQFIYFQSLTPFNTILRIKSPTTGVPTIIDVRKSAALTSVHYSIGSEEHFLTVAVDMNDKMNEVGFRLTNYIKLPAGKTVAHGFDVSGFA